MFFLAFLVEKLKKQFMTSMKKFLARNQNKNKKIKKLTKKKINKIFNKQNYTDRETYTNAFLFISFLYLNKIIKKCYKLKECLIFVRNRSVLIYILIMEVKYFYTRFFVIVVVIINLILQN